MYKVECCWLASRNGCNSECAVDAAVLSTIFQQDDIQYTWT